MTLKVYFFEIKLLQSFMWFRCIDGVLFVWTRREKFHSFLTDLNIYINHIKITYEFNKRSHFIPRFKCEFM